jgi:phytoene synthase
MRDDVLQFAQTVFQKASTTYYYSTSFFPKNVRDDIVLFYAFVRIADDYVDAIPQDVKGFEKFCKLYRQYRKDRDVAALREKGSVATKGLVLDVLETIRMMVELQDKYRISNDLIDSFLDAMKADITKKTYKTIDETITYMYGSAEVIGLVFFFFGGGRAASRLPPQLQGRAMQYINFIRDIKEDNSLGRQYIPTVELKKHGLPDLSLETSQNKPKEFSACIRSQIQTYQKWQDQAKNGYAHIPYRYRVPIMTAAWMYNWTAKKIAKDPHIVFKKKVKPNKFLVITVGIAIAFKQLFNSIQK